MVATLSTFANHLRQGQDTPDFGRNRLISYFLPQVFPARDVITALTDREHTAALLASTESGAAGAVDDLVAHLYEELRAMAHRQLARDPWEARVHTTELVHETYLRLVDSDAISARGRAYFFGAAAQAMRNVLVDAARRRSAAKRGGGNIHVSLGSVHPPAVDSMAVDLLDIDRGLRILEQERPRLARVVELRFFGGLEVKEAAEVLDVSPRTVKSDWALARAWLFSFLHDEGRHTAN